MPHHLRTLDLPLQASIWILLISKINQIFVYTNNKEMTSRMIKEIVLIFNISVLVLHFRLIEEQNKKKKFVASLLVAHTYMCTEINYFPFFWNVWPVSKNMRQSGDFLKDSKKIIVRFLVYSTYCSS